MKSREKLHETGLCIHRDLYRDARNKPNCAIIKATRKHIQEKITPSAQSHKQSFRSADELLSTIRKMTFFTEKVANIQSAILKAVIDDRGEDVVSKSCPLKIHLSSFEPATEDEGQELVRPVKSKSCALAVVPASLKGMHR